MLKVIPLTGFQPVRPQKDGLYALQRQGVRQPRGGATVTLPLPGRVDKAMVHELLAEKRLPEAGAGLDHQADPALLGDLGDDGRKEAVGRKGPADDAEGRKPVGVASGGASGVIGNPGAVGEGVGDQMEVTRAMETSRWVDDDAPRAGLARRQAGGEPGVVGQRRAGPDRDGWEEPAPAHDVGAGRLAGDPTGARHRGGAAGGIAPDLEADERATPDHPVVEEEIEATTGELRRALGETHLDAGGAQQVHPAPGVERVGVERADDHAADSGREEGVDAGRRPAVGAAGLEGHVQRGAGRGRAPEGAQGGDLGVRAAGAGMPALRDDSAILDEDGADHRIGMGVAPGAAGELERAEEGAVVRASRHAQRLRRRATGAALPVTLRIGSE